MSRARNWCFTIYNADLQETSLLELSATHPKLRYAVWQLERCPTTSRLHFQGYVEFTASLRLSAVKEFLGHSSAHCERRRKPRLAAIRYCKKDDTRVAGPWELGSSDIAPGQRRDLDEIAGSILEESLSITEVRRRFPGHYVKYRRGFEGLVFSAAKDSSKSWRQLEVLVYYGEAGTGKTRKAVEEAEDTDYYILDQAERVWFDGYEGEELLIIDDFYGWIKYGQLLRILDGYQYRCEIKGGFTYACWKKVVITSNKHPRDWYEKGLTPALKRRLTGITHFQIIPIN